MQFCRIARAAWIRRSFIKAGKYKLLWLLHGGNSDDTAWQRKTMIEVCAKEKISSSLCRKRTTPSIPIGRRTRCLATTCMIIPSANGCPPSITGSRLRINRRITLSPATLWAAWARLNVAAAPSGKFAAAAVLSVAPVDCTRPAAGNFAENIKAQYIRANGAGKRAGFAGQRLGKAQGKQRKAATAVFCLRHGRCALSPGLSAV